MNTRSHKLAKKILIRENASRYHCTLPGSQNLSLSSKPRVIVAVIISILTVRITALAGGKSCANHQPLPPRTFGMIWEGESLWSSCSRIGGSSRGLRWTLLVGRTGHAQVYEGRGASVKSPCCLSNSLKCPFHGSHVTASSETSLGRTSPSSLLEHQPCN